jgi:hypothetical protein
VACFARPLGKQTNAFFANFAEKVQPSSSSPVRLLAPRRSEPAHPSAARRSRFGAAGLHQRDQLVAVMLEFLVADAGNAAELL